MTINETVLEMHFHRPMIKLFKDTLGIGKGSFNFYKYSPQRECFVGFDQAFVKTDLSEDELFEKLKSSVQNDGYNLSNFFLGYFLQYKVVSRLKNKRRNLTPPQVTSIPHYRISLATKIKATTGFSQHQLLYNLNQNDGALVYYACPMLFDRTELYNDNINWDLLRLANMNDCPSSYCDNKNHCIYFNNIAAEPIWCSEPTKGKAYSPEEVVNFIKQKIETSELKDSQLKLLDALKGDSEYKIAKEKNKILNLVSDSMTIIHFVADREQGFK